MPGTWRPEVEVKLAELLALPAGWNSYAAAPIAPEATQRALALLDAAMPFNGQLPSLVPLSSGGVQIEWHVNGLDIEIEVPAPGERVSVYSEDSRGRWDRDFLLGLDDEPRLLRELLAELGRRG
jgi:hypothetical protein